MFIGEHTYYGRIMKLHVEWKMMVKYMFDRIQKENLEGLYEKIFIKGVNWYNIGGLFIF